MPDSYASRPAGHRGYAGPLESRLSGTGRVADDLWLMAHHVATGKLLLEPRGLGLGLAGGLLAELMLGRGVGLRPDGTPIAGRTWPAAALAYHNVTWRYMFSLSREGVLPAGLSRTGRTSIPRAASLTQSISGLAVIVMFAAAGWPAMNGLFFAAALPAGWA